MPDIRIVPGSSIMSFTSSLNFIERITQDPSGSLNLYGSGSTGRTELLSVDGNNGRLFTVSDDLSDSLFSVNTIAGLPVIEAFADNTVNIGQYSAPPIKVIGSSAIITGSLNGGSRWADTALVLGENTNATRYPLFVSSLNGTPQTIYGDSDGNFTYNPSIDTLTVPIVNSSTAVRGGNGSESAPAFSFSGDTNTGMYNISSDKLGFSTAGTPRMAIDSSGNVGIGTTTPQDTLSISGQLSTGTSDFSIINTEGGKVTLRSGIQGITNSGLSILFANADGSSESVKAVISSAGNVGIGTTTPNSRLDVNGNTTITGSLIVSQSNNTINSIYTTNGTKTVPAYTFINDTDTGMYREGTNGLGLTAGSTVRVVVRDTSLTLIPGSTSIGTHLLMSDSNYIVSNVSTSSLTVGSATNAANIEITDDTTTPVTYYPVFVSATSGSTAARVDSSTLTYNPSANLLRTGRLEATVAYRGASGSPGTPAFSFTGDTNTGMYREGTAKLGFSTGGTAKMVIDSLGSVGIGTTSPLAKLHVEGSFLVNTPNANFMVNPTNIITAAVTSTTYGTGAGFELVDDSAAFGFNPFGDFRGVRANYLEGVWFANESGCKLGLQPINNSLWSEGNIIQTAEVPSNTTTPAAWIKIYNNDKSKPYFIPVYK